MGKRYVTKWINGVEHKFCSGPTHPEPMWVPVHEFLVRKKTGRLRGNCRRCEHHWRYRNVYPDKPAPEVVGWMQVSRLRFAIEELERRLGKVEAARRVGVAKTTWYNWTHTPGKKMQRAKAAGVIRTLREVRDNDEVRSRKDIRRGAAARGETEKRPARRGDYYRPHGDSDTELRKRFRRENSEHENEIARQRRANKKLGLTNAQT